MNREEVIAELRRVAALLDKESVSRSEFKRLGRVSSALVESKFGTWSKALEAAGLVPIDRFKRMQIARWKKNSGVFTLILAKCQP